MAPLRTVAVLLGASALLLLVARRPSPAEAPAPRVLVSTPELEAEPPSLPAGPRGREPSARMAPGPEIGDARAERARERRTAVRGGPPDRSSDPDEHLELFPCPPEQGDAAVFLELRDRDGGTALRGRVELFRLDVPENDCWTAGDESRGGYSIPETGLEIPGLPAGRYRLALLSQRVGAPDPPPFTLLAGTREHVVVFVEMPRELPQFGLLFLEDGTRVDRAERRNYVMSSDTTVAGDASWAHRRRYKGRRAIGIGEGGAGGSARGSTGWIPIEAGPRGFALGTFPEDSRTERHRRTFILRAPGRAPCRFTVDGGELEDGVLVGVSIDPEPALRAVRLPDGRDGRAIRDSIHIAARARRALPEDRFAWRYVEIETIVSHPDFERATSTHRLADGPFPPLDLLPAEDG